MVSKTCLNGISEAEAIPVAKKTTLCDMIFKDLFSDDPRHPRSKLWWAFVAPGKVILWFEYMFPERITSVFGSARRKRSPIVQVLYSVMFYLFVLAMIFIFVVAA